MIQTAMSQVRRSSITKFKRTSDLAVLVLTILGAWGDRAWAHQKWLWPNVFVAENAPAWVSFDVTWGDHPFTAEEGVGEQPLWIVDSAGGRTAPDQVLIGKTKTAAEVELTKPGTYRIEAVDPPNYWTQLEVDGKQQWIQKPKNEAPAGKVTRSDLYYSKAATYVTLGEPTDLPPPAEKEPLDVVPKTHPARVRAGESLALAVLSYGKPAADARINIFGPAAAGHDPDQVIKCDEQGLALFRPDVPGRHLLACDMERPVANDPKADIYSFHVYLTLWVSPREKEK
jgi:uncharacterized GH25 family protein